MYLPWVIHMYMSSAEPLVTKVWSIAQPMIKTSRYSALPISRGNLIHITHDGLIAHPSGRGMGVTSWVQSFMLEVYAACNAVLLYRDISRVYSMFLWLAVFWRYEWRFMGKREITKIDECDGQIVNHSHVFRWSHINPCVHRLSWLRYRIFSSTPIPALSCKCLVFNELMLYWLLFEFRSMLLLYAYFDAGVWNETFEVISIQFPLPNDIANVKLYCIPRYVDFEARTNIAAWR